MFNRLVAENTIKTPFHGEPFFTVSKKLLAFQSGSHCIKVKSLNKDVRDVEVVVTSEITLFSLAASNSWLFVLTTKNVLEVYSIEFLFAMTEGQLKKVALLNHVTKFFEIKDALVLQCKDKSIKTITFADIITKTEQNLNIDILALQSITDNQKDALQICSSPMNSKIFIEKQNQQSKKIIQMYDKNKKASNRYQKCLTIGYLQRMFAIYRDRYAFQLISFPNTQKKQVQICDIEDSKLIGKFPIEGEYRYSQIRQNLLLIITNTDNTDYFTFFVLDPEPAATKPLITNRNVYEKGKGDYYAFMNLTNAESLFLVEKKKNQELSDLNINQISNDTASIIFVLSKSKEKIEVVRLEHSKILKSPFGEEKLDKIIYSKNSEQNSKETELKKEENLEIERGRIHSSMEYKNSDKPLEQIQKRFVEHIIDTKLKIVMKKFFQLQKRVENLQRNIKGIYDKIELSLQNINRQEIKKSVETLFTDLTPQFQKYFTEIFKQVSGVLDQGANYYNLKLAKEAQIHKEALSQIVTDTLKASQEICQVGKKEMEIGNRTEEYLKKLLDAKKKWTKSTEEFEIKCKEVSSGKQLGNQIEGKVFVRADLNHSAGSKKQT